MNSLTLTVTCITLSTAIFLTAGCYQDSPDLVKASRSESSAPSMPSRTRKSDAPIQEALADLALAPQESITLQTGKRVTQRQWEPPSTTPAQNRETYAALIRNATIQTSAQPLSTFSVTTETGKTPWNDKTHLLHIGLKGYVPPVTDTTAANLVFLIDVSGSMNSPDKLGLLKSSISLLSHELTAQDTVSMIVYAGSSGTVLEPTPGNQHRTIDQALSRLVAGGSTNGAQGIELAYELASEHFQENGINRVILATNGDFNVGISDVDSLIKLISQKRKSGIALTTLGFGTGNYNDHLMVQLADAGNGSYAYMMQDSESGAADIASQDEMSMTSPVVPAIQSQSRKAVTRSHSLTQGTSVNEAKEYRRSAKNWLAQIRVLIKEEQPARARTQYDLFRKAFPDYAPDFTLESAPE